ncbi:hypothetical protein SCOR_14370 [Sulfidibacter corallicola]|uniref:Uncharacterized protein n=1 Tax=Sulfidibacter corallicola TaxID=2818388 RepID=A0A8A4TZJ7_SULCO|nr:hypothetical protein [Sulfidibacter corallicola]QTD54352.1 hypothetical protein J3U87_18050 [Sulfidibacter corallicola]
MKDSVKIFPLIGLTVSLLLTSCSSEVNYSRSLFNHIPADPEVLVLIRPNDVTNLLEITMDELDLNKLFDDRLGIDTSDFNRQKEIVGEMLQAVGVPWPQVESVGFLLYFEKPIILLSGNFKQQEVVARIREVGFKQRSNGYFDYIYEKQKLHVPADGLMMMAEEDLLDFLMLVPEENRLWNREDFEAYRRTTPLNNSIFLWSQPPKHFLSDFQYHEELSNVSVAVDFKHNLNMRANVRLKSSEKATYLYDMVLGTVTFSQGMFGPDPEFGPVFKGIKVTQDNNQVIASLVIPASQLPALKERIMRDIENPEAGTFGKLQNFFDRLD